MNMTGQKFFTQWWELCTRQAPTENTYGLLCYHLIVRLLMPIRLYGEQPIRQAPFCFTWRETADFTLPQQNLCNVVAPSTTLPSEHRSIRLIGKTFVRISDARQGTMNGEWHAMEQLPGRPR